MMVECEAGLEERATGSSLVRSSSARAKPGADTTMGSSYYNRLEAVLAVRWGSPPALMDHLYAKNLKNP
jgi:hypothetical protein